MKREYTEAQRRFFEHAASLPEVPACEFCGRCVLVGWCCEERLAKHTKPWPAVPWPTRRVRRKRRPLT